ncbi:hypothetical protein GCM10027598_51190 [Amycolatopsis oliviviridis]|nr:hypothetical protein [Amycolatopsis oliviviridis]
MTPNILAADVTGPYFMQILEGFAKEATALPGKAVPDFLAGR